MTQNGDLVLGEDGGIPLDGNTIFVDKSGNIQVDGEQVGRLSVVSFNDTGKLKKEGYGYYSFDGEAHEILAEPEDVVVHQGYLEESNVVLVEEMVKMVETLRIHESYQKVIQSFDEANMKSVNEVGKL